MRQTGQWLRMIGQLIELVGLIGIVREWGGQMSPRIRLPGFPAVSSAWVTVAVGFILFLVGWILITASKPPRRNSL